MLTSCQIPVKFRTHFFSHPSLFKPNAVHSNTEEDVAALGCVCKSDKQQHGTRVAEADTRTHAHAYTQRTLTWLTVELWLNSTHINSNGFHINMSTGSTGLFLFPADQDQGSVVDVHLTSTRSIQIYKHTTVTDPLNINMTLFKSV